MADYSRFSGAVLPEEHHGKQPVDENLDGIAGNGDASRSWRGE
jgi:hypothetical protein